MTLPEFEGMLRRPTRADARRNYDAVLVAAAEAFADHGPEVAIDEIARRAGVGNATLYRHFPARRDLIVAVCVDEVESLLAAGDRLRASEDPGVALHRWMMLFIEHIAANKGLAAALMTATGDESSLIERCNAAIAQVVAGLLDDAKAAGAIGEGVSAADLLSSAQALALVAESDSRDRAARILRYILDGAAAGRH